MKEYDQEKRGAGPDAAPQKKLSPRRGDAAAAESPDALRGEHLSHPANAEQLAGILSELQQSHGNAYVQQVVSGMNEPRPAVEASAPPGQRLDEGVRAEMETAFGESFGDVRVHTGPDAERVNEELGARAVTRGRDLYFDRGEYEPSSAEGKELLAHELAHVVQQAGGAAGQQANSVGQPGDTYEEEADRAARAVLAGERPPALHTSAAPSYQRQARGGQQPAQQPQSVGGVTVLVVNVNRQVRGTLPHGVKYDPLLSLVDPGAEVLQFTVPAHTTITPLTGVKEFIDTGSPAAARVATLRVPLVPRQQTQTEVLFVVGRHQLQVRFIFPPRP